MPKFIVLAQSEITAKAIIAWLEVIGERPIEMEGLQCIITEHQGRILDYDQLVRRIEKASCDRMDVIQLNEVVMLVDSVDPRELDPLANMNWNTMLAMLILTFPEITWLFGVIADSWDTPSDKNPSTKDVMKELKESWDRISPYHLMPSLVAHPHRDLLLDATGLRNFIKKLINANSITNLEKRMTKKGGNIDESQKTEFMKSLLPIREKTAAAIDEQTNYALFHAYTAYRFGYRADAVRSWDLMKHLFKESSSKGSHDFDILLEDVNLNFPDKPGNVHLSAFASDGENGRANKCDLLGADEAKENSKYRIIVTGGHSIADSDNMKANRKFVEDYKGKEKSGYVLKPVGGMFDLWDKANLFKRLDPRLNIPTTGRYCGQAPKFYWPPIPSKQAEEAGGHSAPGKLMLIAQYLLRRADAQRISANTVDECIRGAVLATDALELLRYKTPTLALHALCLKHEFEVKAEVTFIGVGYHFDLKHRMVELKREINEASSFFEGKRRRLAELDTLVSIGNRLMLVFREAGQFDEEMQCLVYIRSWHRQLRRKQSRKIVDAATNWIMGYAEWLLISPKIYIGMLFVWFIGLWMLWGLCGLLGWLSPEKGDLIIKSASAAWNSFAVANPESTDNAAELILNIVGSAAGLFHLGVFISYLYSAVSRK